MHVYDAWNEWQLIKLKNHISQLCFFSSLSCDRSLITCVAFIVNTQGKPQKMAILREEDGTVSKND